MSHRQIDPRKVLTVKAARIRRLYLKANKDRSGPEPAFDKFLLEAGENLGVDASDFVTADTGGWKTGYDRWKRSPGYRRMQYETKLHGKYLESNWSKRGRKSPFMKAVSAVMAALEDGPGGRPPKPMPSDRELMKIFRPPGKKNCSKEDLERFRGVIFQLAADLTSTKPAQSDE